MVTVRVFGTLRLDSGIKETTVDAWDVQSLYPLLLAQAKENNPRTNVKEADFKGCYVLVNGVQTNKNVKLKDGDVVMLMSPVAGG